MNDHEKKIRLWIKRYLVPAVGTQYAQFHTSYQLKHYCERMIDEYVSNEEMMQHMKDLGFQHRHQYHTNQIYKLRRGLMEYLAAISWKYEDSTVDCWEV